MKHIFFRLFFGFLILIVVFSSVFIYYNFNTTKQHYLESFRNDLKNLNITISDNIQTLLLHKDTTALVNTINKIGKSLEIRITIIGIDGVVIADSKANPKNMDNHLKRPEVIQALSNGTGTSLRYSNTTKDEMLYVSSKISYDGKIIGFVRTSYFLYHIDELYGKLTKDSIKILIVIGLLLLISTYFLALSITKPLQTISTAVEQVSNGNFKTRIQLKSNNEFAILAKNFNDMAAKLESFIFEIERQNNELKHLFNSIPDGIILLSIHHKIILTNITFLKHFVIVDNFLSLDNINIPDEFKDKIKNINDHNKIDNYEFNFNNKSYFATMNYIPANNEILIVVSDITDIRKIEQMKKDFVVNVSHELKTPLTAIKGFIETLEDEIEDANHLHYIQIVRRHTDRLISIVKDLLLLSELEDESYTNKLIISQVDLNILIDNTVKLFEQKLKEKNLTFSLEINSTSPKVQADSFRLEQILVNLFNNSIKFTDQGGIQINVSDLDDKSIQITFSDTGAGIPKEDQDRIFERFYISEKSRSRKFGGTGIGLSIVKHIIMLHNGTVTLDKEYTNGARFVITLPQKYSYK
jgi:two-component system phosphate regulon sensor histidine kinase PhoR